MVRDSEDSFDKPLKVLWVMSKTTVYKCSFSFGGEAFWFDDSVVHGEDEKSKPQAAGVVPCSLPEFSSAEQPRNMNMQSS